jgi:hypothetical protein
MTKTEAIVSRSASWGQSSNSASPCPGLTERWVELSGSAQAAPLNFNRVRMGEAIQQVSLGVLATLFLSQQVARQRATRGRLWPPPGTPE